MEKHFCDKCKKEGLVLKGNFNRFNLSPKFEFELCEDCFLNFSEEVKQLDFGKYYLGIIKGGK
jgi:hypothetical protein